MRYYYEQASLQRLRHVIAAWLMCSAMASCGLAAAEFGLIP
jgi:hypothetical protein